MLPREVEADGEYDLAVVGGGILGLAVARELTARRPGLSAVVLERESQVASHQTGRNSGVIHAGIYYKPGSLKARLCTVGAAEMYSLCERHSIPHERCGKVIVARGGAELSALDELERRGQANGVPGLRRLTPNELGKIEPHCCGQAALHSPNTGIADFGAVARALAEEIRGRGVGVTTGAEVAGVGQSGRRIAVRHGRGEVRARFAVFCAGAWSDRLAIMAGAPADPRIVPFRGAYLRLKPERRSLVRSLIYPVPNPSLPFLGVHLTKHIGGDVLVGPTALLSATRDGAMLRRASRKDLSGTLLWPGTWRMGRRWWRTGVTEIGFAASRRAFVRAAADYVPELRVTDTEPAFAGVRAQAVGRDGALVDDFVMHDTERALHIRNAPSPAATASLAIARMIADRAEDGLG